ncbi:MULTISPECIES: c-type cytochrome [unclassified Acidovorax]|jgi:cytochrome c5|uniref:c-type cytochrome n=1 Tax=unclassified Acidovorax TaxID=2684926 RepID=UPI000B4032B2|nr:MULTISPECIES: c-type cytochrome [unclassified Acidovorax]MBU4423722.1 c-type cytochrome [Gammaproteobacteria bacterium]
MSDNKHHEEAHTGPIKNPKQLLFAVIFSFVIPIFAIIGLVLYVTSDNKTAAGAVNPEKAIAERIQKVGMVEIRDANRPLRGGEEVFKGQCAACHATGAAGAPKLGDAAAWGPRIKSGFDALVQSALKGKNAMAPQGGGEFNDTEIARAVAFMANAGGATFAEPAAPGAPAAAAPAATATPAAAATAPVAAAPAAASANGENLYKQACQVCHGAGIAGAPKFGDKAAWAPRLAAGIDATYASAVQGKGGMPARGGTQASDADLRAAVEYMAAAAK